MIETNNSNETIKPKVSKTGKIISPNNPNQNPDKQWGRTSKLSWFVEAFEELMKTNENDVIYLTDDELRESCNELLEEKAQISEATFKSWKAGTQENNIDYFRFLALYKKALQNQKRNLFTKLQDDPQAWQRFAWIIERKFSEWNLKQISENINKNTNVNHEVEDTGEFKDLLKDNWLI